MQARNEVALRLLAPLDIDADSILARPRLEAVDPLSARFFGRDDLIEILLDPDRRSGMAGPAHPSFEPGPEPWMRGGKADFFCH